MYKEDLALNNLQWLICHKTQPNQKLKPSMSIFKWALISLNSEFSFCKTGYHTKVKEPCLRNNWIHAFPKDISVMRNANSLDLNFAVSISYNDNHCTSNTSS